MKTFPRLFLLFWLLSLAVVAEPKFPIPATSNQVVLVLNNGWDDPTGKLWRFERKSESEPWVKVGGSVLVNLGRTGFAWGSSPLIDLGDTAQLKGPMKKEGDGKSPAGLFPFLKAFGHPAAPKGYTEGENLPFLVVDSHQCVDDSKSPYYNQVVNPKEVGGVTWTSAEKMKIDLYEMGLVVGHNCPKAKPGMGSCIFYHLQSGPKEPTSGCTSMDRASLSALLLWLKKDAEPVVLQLPRSEFERMADKSWPTL